MKKFITVLAGLLMAFCLAFVGCNDEKKSEKKTPSLTLGAYSVSMEVGNVKMLYPTLENASGEIEWTSSDATVATVEKTEQGGLVRALEPGETTITASVGSLVATCEIIVSGASYYPVLILDKTSTAVYVGDSITVNATISVGGVAEKGEIVWTSADSSVATVSDGVITAVSVGKTTVTASVDHHGVKLSETVEVEVKDDVYFVVDDAKVSLAMTAGLNEGEIAQKQLTVTLRVNEELTTAQNVVWESSDEEIVSVDGNGNIVSGKKVGKATVTAICQYAGKERIATVEVETFKSIVQTEAYLQDVDLSLGSFTLPLALLDESMRSFEGNVSFTVGEKSAVGVAEEEKITVQAKNVPYGEQIARIEFEDRIYELEGLFVTKILKTADDVISMTEIAGGRDEKGGYGGYFILGNNIDLGDSSVNAPVDSSADRTPTRGFKGTFDGRGFVLANGRYDNGGLFGTLSVEGTVKNLALINATLAPAATNNGSGMLAQKIFGKVENLLIEGTMAGGATAVGTLAYTSVGASYRNVVVRLSYNSSRSVLPTNGSNNAALVAYMPDSESIFNNVYVLSDLAYEEEVGVFDVNKGNARKHREEGRGIFSALLGKEDTLIYYDLPSSIWHTPESGIPTFKSEEGYVATYRTEYYLESKEKADEYDVALVTTSKSAIGSTVSATQKNFSGYVADVEAANGLTSGKVSADGTLVLKLYYRTQGSIPVANEQDENVYFSLGNAGEISFIRNVGEFAGKQNVYRVTTTTNNPWYTHLTLTGVRSDWMAQNGYTELEFAFFLTKGEADLYLNVYTPVGGEAVNHQITGLSYQNVKGIKDWMQFYDAEGKQTYSIATGAWYTVKVQFVNFDEMSMQRFFVMSNTKQGSYYIADAKLNSVPFDAYAVGADESAIVEIASEKELKTPTLITGWGNDSTEVEWTWASSDSAIVTVENGVLKGVKVGTADVTASCVWNGKTVSVTVPVTVLDAVRFTFSDETLTLTPVPQQDGELSEKQLSVTVTVNGQTVTPETLVWSSDNGKIVSVADGLVKAGTKAGVATITVTYTIGENEYFGSIKIRNAKPEAELDKSFDDVETTSVWTVDLEKDLGISASEIAILDGSPTVTVGGVVANVVKEGSVLTVTFGEDTAYGANDVTVDFPAKTYIFSANLVTKILKTAEDIAKIQEYAGGRDEATDAYDGYFVLGNTIDLGSTKISATVDGNTYRREATRGFQGTFDGRGFVLANGIYADGGLFGTVGRNATVKNLGIYNATLTRSVATGAGLFGVKYFGTLENVSIDCTITSANNMIAPIAYTALAATFKNIVVVADYANTLANYKNENGVLVSYNATKGHDASATLTTPNVYENVYVVTNRIVNGKVELFDQINTQTYETLGKGIVAYADTATDMTFEGLDGAYWTTTGIPHFVKEDSDLKATYTVKHMVQNVGSTEFVVGKTEVKKAIAGSTVTEYGYGYKDRVLIKEVSGTVLADNSLVLECTYKSAYNFTIANEKNKAYVFEMSGSPTSGKQILDFVGDFEGQKNVWRMTSTEINANSRLTVKYIDDATWKSYSYLEFKVYATDLSKLDVIPVPTGGSAYNVVDLANDSKGCIEIFDLDGNKLTQTPSSGWIVIRGYSSKMSVVTNWFRVGVKTQAIPYYVADAKFVK